MLKTASLDNIISEYYDEEMKDSSLLNYEARIAVSKGIRDYANDTCFEYFKITNSIKRVKLRTTEKADFIVRDFNKKLRKEKRKSLLYVNSIFLKRINKRLRNLLLNLNGDNSQ